MISRWRRWAACLAGFGWLAAAPPWTANATEAEGAHRAVAVRDVLQRNCADCHDGGQTQRRVPAGRFGNVLDLESLSQSARVVPGKPDRSRLFTVMQEQHAPLEIFRPFADRVGPSADDLTAVRDWIKGLDRPPFGRCADARAPVATADVIASIEAALKPPRGRAPGHGDARTRRFLSLTHLWNGCAPVAEIAQLARAIPTVLSGLTWRPGAVPVDVVPIARQGEMGRPVPDLVFMVDLRALGISTEAWDWAGQDAVAYGLWQRREALARLRQWTASQAPIVLADRFFANAHGSEHYGRLLKLPGDRETLLRVLGVRPEGSEPPAARLDLAESEVTGRPRRITRHRSRTTTVWLAEDEAASRPVAETPDEATDTTATPAQAPGPVRVLFRLPSGAPAAALFGPDGTRHAAKSNRDGDLSPAGCLGCHAGGPLVPAGTEAATEPVVRHIVADQRPVARIGGLPPVTAFVRSASDDVDLMRAAAELGVAPAVFVGVLSELAASGTPLARRLSQEPISSEAFRRLTRRLMRRRDTSDVSTPESPGGSLVIWSEREVYQADQALRLSVVAPEACYPTVISVDAVGDAIVLYPNGFTSAAKLDPGEILSIPSADAPYELRTRLARGPLRAGDGDDARYLADREGHRSETNRVLAFCSPTADPVLAIVPDYDRQVFPILGAWEAFLADAAERMRTAEDPAVLERRARAQRRRRRRAVVPIYDARPKRWLRAETTYQVRPAPPR